MPETKKQVDIEKSWLKALGLEFDSSYFRTLKVFLQHEKATQTIYPPGKQIFSAFNHTPLPRIKVVIIGQDPYHGPGQANGLCFSVADGIKHPPSLVNIFKELQRDLGIPYPKSGNLEKWADQGVFLLNATLTVRQSQAGSHQGKGWEQFTDAVIRTISAQCEGVVFMLWGKFAQAKEALIDTTRHHVLKTTHPSPFSAHYGFLGSGHFSRCNQLLLGMGKPTINWALE